jgi:hypothetical protein
MASRSTAPRSGPVDLAACRRPDKQVFASQEAVWAWLLARPVLRRGGNTPYRCPAGHWHYGRAKPRGRRKGRPA